MRFNAASDRPEVEKKSDISYWTSVLVWSTVAIMVLIPLICALKYGYNLPLAEDWLMVAPLTGNEPNFLDWLWAQNNEHRIPLPRLVYLGLLTLTQDFRVGMFFNIILLGFIAATFVLTARNLRGGKTKAVDVFFPIALLHLGHWENLLWSWQIAFVMPASIICILIATLTVNPSPLTSTAAIVAGVSIVLLPLCSAIGLAFVPILALWLAYCAIKPLQDRSLNQISPHIPRWSSIFLLTTTGIALCLIVAYFIGYEKPYWNPPSPGVGATFKTTAQLLALGFGSGVAQSWKLSVFITFGLFAATALVLVRAVLQHHGLERQRALGLGLLFINLLLITLAIGQGRAGLVPSVGLPARYALLAVPILCLSFLVWELYSSRRQSQLIQTIFLVAVLLLLPLNIKAGFGWRDWYSQGMNAVQQDIIKGVPIDVLAERHRNFLVHWWEKERLIENMQMLHDFGVEPFVQINNSSNN